MAVGCIYGIVYHVGSLDCICGVLSDRQPLLSSCLDAVDESFRYFEMSSIHGFPKTLLDICAFGIFWLILQPQ